jgi:hypothetical protein
LLAVSCKFSRDEPLSSRRKTVSNDPCSVTIISIVRLKALYDNLNGPINLQPVTGVDIALWSDLEINVAIICGSVPALKAFVGKVFFGQSIGGSSDRSCNNYGNTSQSRKQTRNQSQVLGSQIGDEEAGGSGKMGGITVQQSIEMKSYLADDTGSEKELITGPEGVFGGGGSGRATNIKSSGRRTVVEARAL